ncbi:hypothetical protein THIX_30796 [Thiomonas sp. X19]|nr:hypothetical protein THIX_30796 [Thiomonas sp. X19]
MMVGAKDLVFWFCSTRHVDWVIWATGLIGLYGPFHASLFPAAYLHTQFTVVVIASDNL